MHHARDSGIAFSAKTVDEPTPISFPIPTDPDLQKHIPPLPKNTNYEKPPRYIYDYDPYPEKPLKKANGSGGDTQSRARVKSLSDVPSSTLVKLLLKDESVSKKTRKILAATVSQLESATQRAVEAEAAKRAIENKSLLDKAKLSTDAAQAKDEAHRMKLELETYRLKLRQAEDEVRRAHESVRVLDERRNEAEKAVVHARMAARKYRGEKLVMVARQQGRSEGYKQGLTLGREVASARMKELELSGGYDDYYGSEIVGDGHAYIEEYNDDEDSDQEAAYSSRPISSHPRDRKRDEHHHPRSRHLSMTSRPTSRREAESSRRQSNSTRGGQHAHRDPEPRKSQSHHTSRNETPVVETAAAPPIPPPVVQQTPSQQTPSQPPPSTAPSSPALPIPPPRPSQVSREYNGYGRESNTGSPVVPLQQQQLPPVPYQPQSQPTPNSTYTPSSQPSEPEVIAIREPVQYTPPSPTSQSQASTQTQTQPLVQSPFNQPPPPMNTLPPQQSQSPQVDSGILEYVPMPEPPINIPPEPPAPAPAPAQPQSTFIPPQMSVPPQSPTEQVVQAPVPQTSSRNSSRTEERASEREAEVSTPSTMTGITAIAGGLRSFPAAPVPPSSAGSVGAGGGGVPGYAGSNGSSTGGGDFGFNARLGGGERRRELSTIYEQSTEGTPRMLTPHNTGLSQSQRSDTSSRVDEWRKSLSLVGQVQEQEQEQEQERSQTPRASNAYPSSFLHPPLSAGRPPFHTSDSQGTLDSNLSSNRYSVYDNDLRRRTSSGSTRSTRSASININIEPPSRPTSADTRTPVPESNGGHSGDYAPFNTTQSMGMSMGMSRSGPSGSASGSGSGYQPSIAPPAGGSYGYGYIPPDQRMTPGYLSPNRSPMDLAPIALDPDSGPPVIPGQGLAKLKSAQAQASVGGRVPVPVNNGLPAGFILTHVQPSPGQPQRPVPRTYNQDDDDDGEDTETEGSTTSSRRNLMNALYSGSPMGAIPPGVVTGGSPLVRSSSSLGSAAPKYGTGTRFAMGPTPAPSSSSSGGNRWPPGPGEPLSNPLPRPPQVVSWGDTTRAPQVYSSASSGHFEPPRPPSAAATPDNGTPIPIPNPTLNWRGTPRMGAGAVAGNFSPSMVAATDQMLPGGSSPRSQSQSSKRSSMHAGVTPLSSAQPLPSAMKSNWRNPVSTSASTSGKSPLPFHLRGFPATDSIGSRTASGSGSGGGSPSDSDSEFDVQTQENTLANSRTGPGGSPYVMSMPISPSMQVYRS
ncbi:hypothetical protein Moror_2724 [Moniliophthora roreri MCA 2997]|uniref:Uncharacterized protein n=2 Tax=Moniliophthora roreri TaxID=221103 RepID=V2XCD1_MONRO|nr:hypothetical protein Moror_2724 [Moniliophthora roreri MCA 2997]KAI3603484.1 hypothetical protein WG66_014316 [Moniliophthora roreri]